MGYNHRFDSIYAFSVVFAFTESPDLGCAEWHNSHLLEFWPVSPFAPRPPGRCSGRDTANGQ
jgi:hypothetical protein